MIEHDDRRCSTALVEVPADEQLPLRQCVRCYRNRYQPPRPGWGCGDPPSTPVGHRPLQEEPASMTNGDRYISAQTLSLCDQ
jgi:hypothetical protein